MNENDEILIETAEIRAFMQEVMMPHEGQVPIGAAIFYEYFKNLFINCGRSFGKSQIASYVASRIAIENPGSTNFIFGPFIGQMKEIYWVPGLIHRFIPEYLIDSINNTEMRITLNNGSFIRICGADNFDAYRGIKLLKGSICVIEEVKDIKKTFLDAFLPNLSVNNPILMMIGTPPNFENHFITYMNRAIASDKWFYYNAPSSTNPHVSREFLEEQKDFLIKNGMEDVWLSEYMAQFVKGGHRSVFPMVAKKEIYKLSEVWPKDSKKWDLFVGMDPASSSTFAVEFFIMNKYTKKIITCGEVYESRAEFMSARRIYDAVNLIIDDLKKLGIGEIFMTYDCAARWFANEIVELDKESKWWLTPCDKSGGLEGEISCIRGVAAHDLITFTDASQKLKWELDNYVKDENGKLKDKDDHAWQSLAYALKLAGFDYSLTLEAKKVDSDDEKRFHSIQDDFLENNTLEEI